MEFGGPNYGFQQTYQYIYNHIDVIYPEVEKSHIEKGFGHCEHQGGRCSISNMIIRNPDTQKAVILSFWDRGLEVVQANQWPHAWGTEFKVVHVIGGLGIDPQKLSNYDVKFTPFLYPLELESRYRHVENVRVPYVFEQKQKKVCFIGSIYGTRKTILEHMTKHPMVDAYDHSAGYINQAYFEKMNEYALTLSLNGNGEWCMRDFESMGLGIPVIRCEAVSPLYAPLVPDVDYVRGADPALDAWMIFPWNHEQRIAEQFIDRIECIMKEPETLTKMSARNVSYFDENVYPEKIGKKFFDIFDLNELR